MSWTRELYQLGSNNRATFSKLTSTPARFLIDKMRLHHSTPNKASFHRSTSPLGTAIILFLFITISFIETTSAEDEYKGSREEYFKAIYKENVKIGPGEKDKLVPENISITFEFYTGGCLLIVHCFLFVCFFVCPLFIVFCLFVYFFVHFSLFFVCLFLCLSIVHCFLFVWFFVCPLFSTFFIFPLFSDRHVKK